MATVMWGRDVAETYDAGSPEMFDPSVLGPTVDVLAELAGGGPVLEFAIGTGRVALPLRNRGVAVHGIELSPHMVEQMRTKPAADTIPVTIGDMTEVRVDGGPFTLAYLVFNTIMNVTTQDAQVACFRNASAHLEPGGHFVIEVVVPGLQRLAPGQVIQDFQVSEDSWGLDEYDVVDQGLKSHSFRFVDGEVRHQAVPFRYAWPAELDLMARIAGMDLRERWAGWKREPFTAESRQHVSVWQKAVSG
jgi:hypothetical protein